MHDGAIQVLLLPGLRVPWQHDGGMHDAAGHRTGQRFVQQHLHAPPYAALVGQPVDHRLPLPPGQSRTARSRRTRHSPIVTGS